MDELTVTPFGSTFVDEVEQSLNKHPVPGNPIAKPAAANGF